MNRVREIREAKGISLEELARRVNIMPFWLQRIEQYDWDKSSYGLDFDMRLAEALGVHVTEIFPCYAPPKKEPEPQPKPDLRTPEQVDEELRMLNENLRNRGAVNDEWTRCEYTESQPGVFEGIGSFGVWQRIQKQRGDNK